MSKKKKEAQADEPAALAVETHAEAAGTPAWLFQAARAKFSWPVGFELTREDFDQAILATRTERIE